MTNCLKEFTLICFANNTYTSLLIVDNFNVNVTLYIYVFTYHSTYTHIYYEHIITIRKLSIAQNVYPQRIMNL